MEKQCTKCKEIKNISEFYKNKNTKDGFSYVCKICSKNSLNNWKVNNKEKVYEYHKKYFENNKPNFVRYSMKYAQTHKDIVAKKDKKFSLTDKGKLNDLKKLLKIAKKEKTKQKLLLKIAELQEKINNNFPV